MWSDASRGLMWPCVSSNRGPSADSIVHALIPTGEFLQQCAGHFAVPVNIYIYMYAYIYIHPYIYIYAYMYIPPAMTIRSLLFIKCVC